MNRQEETQEKERAETRQQSIRILVVEDETLFAKAICKRFRKAGHTCENADSLAKADQLIKEQEPHLIVLDMRLPDGSGLEFLAQLRESETTDIPVVVLTAYGELEDAVAAMKLKALDYLKKPIDLDELLLTVEKALSKIELERRLDYSKQRESHTIEKRTLDWREFRDQSGSAADRTHRTIEFQVRHVAANRIDLGRDRMWQGRLRQVAAPSKYPL